MIDELAERRARKAALKEPRTPLKEPRTALESPRMPSQSEYESREAQLHHKQLREVESAPLDERKEGASAFHRAMKHQPDIVAERVGWLLDGNYGYGSMKAAHRVAKASGRTNKVAQLTQMIGAREWRSPPRMTATKWKTLSPSEKRALDEAVKGAIRDWERDYEE